MDGIIKIEGKPIEKLIDVVSKAVGELYEPRQIVRKAKAEAKAELILAIGQARTKAILDGETDKVAYFDRINERLVNKEIKRQKNIENVVAIAGNALQSEERVSDEPVNQDWTARFFDIVQDISDDEMHLLWGQILAGEIKKPQSYSLRTLELLRNMTKDEAELFQKVAQFTLVSSNSFIFSDNKVLEKFGVSYSDTAKMVELGLLQPGDFVQMNYSSPKNEEARIGIIYGDIVVLISLMEGAPKVSIPARSFTTPGEELSHLIKISPNIDYVKELASKINRDGVKVAYSKITNIEENGSVIYEKPLVEL